MSAKEKDLPWCECGDSLRCLPILDKKGMIIGHLYYCFGCDEYYILTKISHTMAKKLEVEK